VAAEQGGAEVNLAVLAATLVDVVDFFPVTLLIGVSRFLFTSLALAFCLSLLASFVVAMTVIPLFCSRFLRAIPHAHAEGATEQTPTERGFNAWFNRQFNRVLDIYERWVRRALQRPALTVALLICLFLGSLAIYPFLGRAFFPQTDAGQFTMNVKVPTGTRIENTNQYVAKIEDLVRHDVPESDMDMIVSNIGVVNDFSSLYTSNAGMYTATIQTALKEGHKGASLDYMEKVKHDLASKFPDVRAFFQSGSMVDAILNSGMPAPIDVQVNTRDLGLTYRTAQELARRIAELPGVGQIYIPQDMNYPAIRLNIDRVHAGELGLTQKEIVDNVITALNSNTMIAPNYWVDYQTGNDYFLSVQYAEHGHAAIRDLVDLKNIPLRAPGLKEPTTLDTVVSLEYLQSPTEVDHYKIQRIVDIYVTPKSEDLGKLYSAVQKTVADAHLPSNIRVDYRGMVEGMNASLKSFAQGFLISFILLVLILIAQFRSFIDPILICLAIPMGFIGVLVILPLTHTTLNVMSLMGVLMLIGIADSNSILIVDFAHRLREQGTPVLDAIVTACRVRLRPILMTTLATIIGMIPMAMKLGEGGEQYTPMARAIIGGLATSVVLTVFIVPAAYLLVYRNRHTPPVAQA
jgi:multidrug efflux pump subunit AcrB